MPNVLLAMFCELPTDCATPDPSASTLRVLDVVEVYGSFACALAKLGANGDGSASEVGVDG